MSTTVYTYNDRLVGVGNDQILGTSQGGGVSYTAGDYISIDNDEISVTGISAGDGTLSIAQNVTGAPLNITYPTDVAPDSVVYQIDSVTGTAYSNSTAYGVINYYYGETPADFNGSDDSVLFTINDNISNVVNVNFYYTNSAAGMGGPGLSSTSISGGSTGILQSGTYKVKAQYNAAGTSSPYGKYLQIMFGWRNYASDAAQSLQWAQEALSKITFFGVARPDPSLGVNVNLDRYYLGGNVVTNKPTNSGLPAQIWLNPDTKKQEVYLPNTVPSSWNLYGNDFINYTSTPTSIGAGIVNKIAYKYDSATDKYIYARMTCNIKDTANNIKKAEFVTLEPVSGNFEKWTYDWSDYSNRHWTTETIETGGGSTYTAGDYISIENDEIAVTGVGNLVAGNNITITESGNNITISSEGGGSTYTAGQYISIDGNDVIAVTGLAPVSGSDGIAVNDNVVSLDTPVEIVAGENITISVTGASAIFSAQTVGVTEAQVYDATVTAVQTATGEIPTFTEGNCIDITSNAISWETTAGITDIVSVTALPANPVATVIYLIPET